MSADKKVTIIQPEKKRNQRLRVAGYARVSSDSEDQLHSFQSQIDYFYQKIENDKKSILVDVYVDEGITGTRMDKRDGFNRMIDDCNKGKIDKIITKSISRFARNILETLRVLRELKALGVSVYFERENIDTANGSSEVMLSIYSLMAESESRNNAMNQRWGFRIRAEKGIYNQPHLPYGYKRDENNEIVVDKEEAEIVRMIYDMYLNQGISTVKIEEYLNAKHIGNRKWSRNGITLMLLNERYCGDMLLQKKYTTDEFPYRLIRNNGDIAQYYVYDVFPKIVERETVKKSTDKLLEAKEKYNKNQTTANAVYPFTSIVRCLNCGNKFKRKMIRNIPYWSCTKHLGDKDACDIKAVSEQELMDGFVSVYHRLKDNLFMLEEYKEHIKDYSMNKEIRDELIDIEQQLSSLIKEKEQLYHYMQDDLIDFHIFNRKMNELQVNKSLLELEKSKRNEKVLRNLEIIETTSIINTLKMSNMNNFDELIFARIVDSIDIDEDSICYNLKNELIVKIERKRVNKNVS